LGILTTTPELFLGINAIIKNIESVSLGNLLGGIIVIFALLFGLTLFLNKKIKTDGDIKKIIPKLSFIFLPFLLGLKGGLNYIDGILFLFLYFIVIFYDKIKNKILSFSNILDKKEKINNVYILKNIKDLKFWKEFFLFITSLASLLILSYFIIDIAEKILIEINVSNFIIGLIIFSIGTNLPELIVALKSRKNKNGLAISHLIGSGMANVFILGILLFFKKFDVVINTSYLFTFFFTLVILILVGIFYKTKKSFSKKEGLVLIFIYILFIIYQFILI